MNIIKVVYFTQQNGKSAFGENNMVSGKRGKSSSDDILDRNFEVVSKHPSGWDQNILKVVLL